MCSRTGYRYEPCACFDMLIFTTRNGKLCVYNSSDLDREHLLPT